MSATLDPNQIGSACPSCQSTQTIRIFERFGEQFFFCFDCETSWFETGQNEKRITDDPSARKALTFR